MDSIPLLKNVNKINILLHSKTFDDELKKGDRLATAILKHYNPMHLELRGTSLEPKLEFIRTPLETKYNELKKIVEYELVKDTEGKIRTIHVKLNGGERTTVFRYGVEHISRGAKKVFNKSEVSETEENVVKPVFVQASYNAIETPNTAGIFVTNNEKLLKYRLWFEWRFLGFPLNIMSIKEASDFLDLFFKKNQGYYVRSGYTFNEGLWYWVSTRLKIPHYNVGDPFIDALAYRLQYALRALDEMGIQYYLGVNNDTMDNTLYHFNYLISLITHNFRPFEKMH